MADLKALALKYYITFLVGQPKKDAQGITLDAQGLPTTDITKMVPEFELKGNPSAEVIAAIGKGSYYQCQFLEAAEENTKMIGGVLVDLGPTAPKLKTVNVFESKYKVIYNAIAQQIANGKVVIVVPFKKTILAGGKEIITCTAKIEQFAMPGYWLKADCGFNHYMYTRNPLTHILEERKVGGWDDKTGKWLENKRTTINWVDVFLFGSELDAAEAIFKLEVAAAKKFEFIMPAETQK
jgi:hypothetical protein